MIILHKCWCALVPWIYLVVWIHFWSWRGFDHFGQEMFGFYAFRTWDTGICGDMGQGRWLVETDEEENIRATQWTVIERTGYILQGHHLQARRPETDSRDTEEDSLECLSLVDPGRLVIFGGTCELSQLYCSERHLSGNRTPKNVGLCLKITPLCLPRSSLGHEINVCKWRFKCGLFIIVLF